MKVLSEATLRGFEERMRVHLRAAFAQALTKTTDADLLELIRTGITDARRYGIVAEPDAGRYLEYMIEYGPDFDRNPNKPWAARILATPGALGWKKMDDLDAFTTFELRE
jgi:hypothetical protein